MTLKSDAEFEEKLTLGSRNGKSENLLFAVLFLLIAYKVSATKVQRNYLS